MRMVGRKVMAEWAGVEREWVREEVDADTGSNIARGAYGILTGDPGKRVEAKHESMIQ